MQKISRTRLLAVTFACLCTLHWYLQSVPPPPRIDSTTVSQRPLILYFPEAVIQFAKAHPQIESNDELRGLVARELTGHWFIAIEEMTQRDGKKPITPWVVRPGLNAYSFMTTIDYLKTAAGNPPEACIGARLIVIPADLVGMEPKLALRELEARFGR